MSQLEAARPEAEEAEEAEEAGETEETEEAEEAWWSDMVWYPPDIPLMEAGTLPPENTLTVGRTEGGLDARKYSNSWLEVYIMAFPTRK